MRAEFLPAAQGWTFAHHVHPPYRIQYSTQIDVEEIRVPECAASSHTRRGRSDGRAVRRESPSGMLNAAISVPNRPPGVAGWMSSGSSEPSRASARLHASLRLSASGEQTVCRIAGTQARPAVLHDPAAIVAPSWHARADPGPQATASARAAPPAWRCARWSGIAADSKAYFRSGPGLRGGRGHARSCARGGGTGPGVEGRGLPEGGTGAGATPPRNQMRKGAGGCLVAREAGALQRRSATRSRQERAGPLLSALSGLSATSCHIRNDPGVPCRGAPRGRPCYIREAACFWRTSPHERHARKSQTLINISLGGE